MEYEKYSSYDYYLYADNSVDIFIIIQINFTFVE